MEEMQQLDGQSELQNDQQQIEVGTELTNMELLKATMGLNDEPATEENQTGEDDTIIDEESEEAGQEQGNNFYTAAELFELIKNNQEVDDSRVTDELKLLQNSMLDYKKSLQGDYTKKTQEVAKEKKTVKEQLEALQKEKELINEAQQTGLNVQELSEIKKAVNAEIDDILKSKNLIYDELSETDKEIVNLHKQDLEKKYTDKRVLQNKVNNFDNLMKKTYGDKYADVDKLVSSKLKDLSVRQFEAFTQAVSGGNFDIAKSIYDEAYNELYGQPTQKKAQQQQQQQTQKQVIMPPHSVAKSNVAPKKAAPQPEWKKFI